MKGVEGLPLKYIAIVLVAAIVIAAVYSIVSNFTSTASTNAQKFQNTSTGVLDAASADLCYSGCATNTANLTAKAWEFNTTTALCNCTNGKQ